MKNLNKYIAVIALVCSAGVHANASNKFIAGDSSTSTALCMAAVEGNKLKLYKAIQDSGLTKHYVAEEIQCNGLNFVAFVEQHGKKVETINRFITNGKYDGNINAKPSEALANVGSR